MKTYTVIGEYGIQQGEYVQKEYRAHSPENAIKRFTREVRKEVGYSTWCRMHNNIHIQFIS